MDEGAVDTFSFAMPLSGMLQVSLRQLTQQNILLLGSK